MEATLPMLNTVFAIKAKTNVVVKWRTRELPSQVKGLPCNTHLIFLCPDQIWNFKFAVMVRVVVWCQSSFHVQAKSEILNFSEGWGSQSSSHVQTKSEILNFQQGWGWGGVSHVCIGLCPSSNFEYFLSGLCLGVGIIEVFTWKTSNGHSAKMRPLLGTFSHQVQIRFVNTSAINNKPISEQTQIQQQDYQPFYVSCWICHMISYSCTS